MLFFIIFSRPGKYLSPRASSIATRTCFFVVKYNLAFPTCNSFLCSLNFVRKDNLKVNVLVFNRFTPLNTNHDDYLDIIHFGHHHGHPGIFQRQVSFNSKFELSSTFHFNCFSFTFPSFKFNYSRFQILLISFLPTV